jgi:hypothetical protein
MPTVVGGAAAGVLLAPWLAFNEVHYHALTGGTIAKNMQMATINPQHIHYTLQMVIDAFFQNAFFPVLPEEWNVVGRPTVGWFDLLLSFLLVPGALALCIATRRRFIEFGWVVVLAFAANLGMIFWLSWQQQWPSELPRYVFSTLQLVMLGMAAGAVEILRRIRPYMILTALCLVAILFIWIDLEPQVHYL